MAQFSDFFAQDFKFHSTQGFLAMMISIIMKRVSNLSKGQLRSSNSEVTIRTQQFFFINPQKFLAMMIEIIITKVKNLSEAWLRSKNSSSVFKFALHDDFNHHVLWHSLFHHAPPNKLFQEQRIPQIMDVEMNPPWDQNQKSEGL
ncbi:hypothetical protein PRUPE_2G053200 [Prunus persica]|uniref:Uncharacterized protein n=1 Tax=Prunus persica TaxID=3760 RepID=A0A251QBJ1_PRUPE|nr:hypothetical protein PRUPE_2G053200 [Prunus persica]